MRIANRKSLNLVPFVTIVGVPSFAKLSGTISKL